MYPSDENVIVVPIRKRMEIIMRIQVCLISRKNFDCKKWLKEKLFLQIQSMIIMHPYEESMIVVPITKIMVIITRIQVYLILRMNFDYKENRGKKIFLTNLKHQYHVSQIWEHDCSAHNKKNGNYYEYQNLSHFPDKLLMYRKWWKEKLLLQIESINVCIAMRNTVL